MTECVLKMIAASCDRYPQSTSVVFGDSRITYNDLSIEVMRASSLLKSYGVSRGDLVAVSIERSEKLIPILLGIWCLGAAYLPIDPAYPKDRKEHMLTDAGAALVVTSSVEKFDLAFSGKLLSVDKLTSFELSESALQKGLTQWSDHWHPSDMAYMIYTSGSTGKPKGIAVSQANVHNFLLGMLERPGLEQSDVLLATTTICFDIHVLELFLPLVIGAAVHIVSRHTSVSGDRLRQYINEHQVSVLQATPATWRILLNDVWKPAVPLKILVGGEPFPPDMTELMIGVSSSVWNMYGPTETTVWSTCYQVIDTKSPVKIGTPIRNTQVYVVDEQLQRVKQGEVGELLIGGDGVSMGYYNQEEKNRQSFIDMPFEVSAIEDRQGKLYRTGDLVKQCSDMSLQYVQRKDDQFKIRGYRIEAGDIEAHIMCFKGVSQVVVTVNQFASGDDRLVAHVKSNGMINVQALRDHCKGKLPYFMIPQHFNQVNHFPQTENGKVDRKSLSLVREFYSADNLVAPQFLSARDDLDLSILEVWRKQLSLNDLSIDDDFVELGGNSMIAVKLSEEMERVTGVEFLPDPLFRHRTVRDLVDSIGENKTSEAASVVQLNSVKEGVPVFCLSGVQVYQSIANELDDRQPVYAIYAREELALADARNSTASLSVNNLTRAYIDAIKRQCPQGPYILMGLSFGGMLAVDVATTLKQQGEEVDFVVMFDSCLSYAKKRTISGFLVGMVSQCMGTIARLLCALKERFLVNVRVNESFNTGRSREAIDFFRMSKRLMLILGLGFLSMMIMGGRVFVVKNYILIMWMLDILI